MINSTTRLPRDVLPYSPSGLPACGGVPVMLMRLSVPVCMPAMSVCLSNAGRKKKFVLAVRDLLIMGFACSFVCNNAHVCKGYLCWYKVVLQEIESF